MKVVVLSRELPERWDKLAPVNLGGKDDTGKSFTGALRLKYSLLRDGGVHDPAADRPEAVRPLKLFLNRRWSKAVLQIVAHHVELVVATKFRRPIKCYAANEAASSFLC